MEQVIFKMFLVWVIGVSPSCFFWMAVADHKNWPFSKFAEMNAIGGFFWPFVIPWFITKELMVWFKSKPRKAPKEKVTRFSIPKSYREPVVRIEE